MKITSNEVVEGVLAQPSEMVADRYRIEGTLGRGGMAIVYQVLDTATGERLALKRLRARERDGKPASVPLFEREFLTLSQLVHPRIVSVFDYGVDAEGPYYTMELLDGGDLQRLAPLDFRRACAVARDVCSALSLLHSRRMVYRDLSPRNVRCTSNGQARLIDFGAMTPMGPSREWIGTLPFCAPEAIHSQPLDARTDLYALGATLYYTLTGRHAYPARDVAHLYDLWQSPPLRPSEYVPGIPDALDTLVLDLVQTDRAARLTSAAEAMERLSAIASLPPDEQLLVSQAYLSMPTLVGREKQLDRVRRAIARLLKRHGTSLVFRGAPGSGRSRLVEACVLEAKLAGAIVLQADSSDAHEGSYGAVRALCRQLLEAVPDITLEAAEPQLPILGHVLPELVERQPGTELEALEDRAQLGRRVQPALRKWLFDITRHKPILIAIDDVDRLDDPSIAFVSLLSQELSTHALTVAASMAPNASGSPNKMAALNLLASGSSFVAIEALDARYTKELLGSVFGDVPHLQLLAHHVHEVSRGNPRDIMRLAQHLVDTRMVRYQAGVWSIPQQTDAAFLPSSMAQTLKAKVDALSPDARQLAETMAYEPRQRFDFEECLLLTAHRQAARLVQSLDELVAAEMVGLAGRNYRLGQQGFVAALREGIEPARESEVHLRLAELFAVRGDGFRVAQHRIQGGDAERGVTALVEQSERSQQQTDANPAAYFELLASLPTDWFAFFVQGLELAQKQGRKPRELYQIRARLAGLISMSMINADSIAPMAALVDQLHRDSGLDIYEQLGNDVPPGERLSRMFEQAWARYNGSPETDRVLDPTAALRQLARAMIQAVGLIAFSNDYSFWKKLPSLSPFVPLSPALGVVSRLVDGQGARLSSRNEQAVEIYRGIVQRVSEPDGAGLDASHQLHTRLRVTSSIGVHEAWMGRASCLSLADELQNHPLYETSGILIRMLYHLWQGDVHESERCKRQVELLQIQSTSPQTFDGQYLFPEITAHALADDLTRVKRTTEVIELLARNHRGWAPVLHYALGEYHRIRGDRSSALQELETSLLLMEPGGHQMWPFACGAHLRTLLELERYDEVKNCADLYQAIADQTELGYVRNYFLMPLALGQSRRGEKESALAIADAVIESFRALGSTGLNLALAYETRACIAIDAGDNADFDKYARLASEQIQGGAKRMLGAKYERLARAKKTVVINPMASDETSSVSEFTLRLRQCNSAIERARCGLEVLTRYSGALGGLLYAKRAEGLVRTSTLGDVCSDAKIQAWAEDYFKNECIDREATRSIFESQGLSTEAREWRTSSGQRYVPVLLSHQSARGFVLTGLAVLVVAGDTQFIYPSRFAGELSRSTLEAGDATATYV